MKICLLYKNFEIRVDDFAARLAQDGSRLRNYADLENGKVNQKSTASRFTFIRLAFMFQSHKRFSRIIN